MRTRQFHLDEQIAAQPNAVREILGRENALPALDPGRPIVFTGEGSSLHACRIAASWTALLTRGAIRPLAIDAHSLALEGSLRRADQVVVVSHRGTKRFSRQVLDVAAAANARTICVAGEGAPDLPADEVIRTCGDETSATHTVSWLTALVVLGRLIAPLGEHDRTRAFSEALTGIPAALDAALAEPPPTALAGRLATRAPVLVAGFGLEAVTADEVALKLKEGAYLWAEGMNVESALHGPVAVYGPEGAAIVIDPPCDDGGRAQGLAEVCEAVGMEVIRCGAAEDADLRVPDVAFWTRPLVSAVPLQRLVAELARVRGSNPDTMRTDEEPWAGAMKRVRL